MNSLVVRREWLIWLGAALIVGLAYRWVTRATGEPLDFGRDQLGGYYNYLTRGLASGHLYLPIEPHPELRRLANPYDPAVPDAIKVHDLAYYRGRYFLYHGIGPAVMVFLPWRWITGHDLPEITAALALAWLGYLCWSAALLRWLARAGIEWPAWRLGLAFAALGFCANVPFLLNRVFVYEVAIAGGYFAIAALFLALSFPQRTALVAAGLAAGLAIACRPHLGLVAILVFVCLLRDRDRRDQAAFLAPLAIVGSLLLLYNWARFDHPFEFGIRYLMSGPNQNRIRLALENVPVGLRILLAQAPDWSPVFPWTRMVIRPDLPFPAQFFVEPAVGSLFLAPFLPALLMRAEAPLRRLQVTAALASAAVLLFIALTGWVTPRYPIDFLPMAVFAATLSLPRFGLPLSAAAVLFGIFINSAVAISGPLEGMARTRPANYVRLASAFTFRDEHRIRVNPPIRIEVRLREAPPKDFRELVVEFGHPSHRVAVWRVRRAGELFAEMDGVFARASSTTWRIELADGALRLNANEPLVAPKPVFLMAPSEVRMGPAVSALVQSPLLP